MAGEKSLWRRGLKLLEVPVGERETLSVLKNPDLQPIPAKDQQWGFWSNFAYWGVISFSVGTWISANSALSVGLSYGETIGTFIVGDVVTIVFTLANSYQGYDWKVGYTLSQRFVFGIYGSGLGILVRILMSVVNYGSNAWLGGLCINMILDSWSHHYLTLPNTLSSHVAMTTKQVIGFMIFHVVTAFFYFAKPKSMNYFLIASCVATCFAMMGMIIYLCKEAHGVGQLLKTSKTTVSGSTRSWAWVYMVSYWFGSVSPGSTNQSDYSRFASSKTAIYAGTICALLIPTTLIPVFGVIGASTTAQLYGDALWMPMDITEYWLTTNYSSGARAASFFCGLAFTCSQIAYTISNCGFAAGMDLSGVLPKYINIFRGAIFCAVVSFAVQPWNFYNSSSVFLVVMSSFGVVMTPLISVMIADNFLVHKRQYSVSEAFILKGEYYYTLGVNWRAMFAFVCGMAPGLPGIAGYVNPNLVKNKGINNFFLADSFTSFLISFFTYWILCLIFPVKINVRQDDKDYYGGFTDEVARKKGMIPYSELTPEEVDVLHYRERKASSSEDANSDVSKETDRVEVHGDDGLEKNQ
ncbi:LAMI_0H19042g1_1 [Lachancea mirantina]|uniref:LAMI_0H19042g1_1 n=1 Tax=Lachancea mirantina TaxID=1230905 RepID=A0A1G4KK17_9SACH|nr:LAMI_0H19042g1_1 [Lachancea mirantina]